MGSWRDGVCDDVRVSSIYRSWHPSLVYVDHECEVFLQSKKDGIVITLTVEICFGE